MLKINALSKIYKKSKTNNNEVRALDNVSISFNKNELVFVVGKSGSGKSTLLNIIGKLDKPTNGELYLEGKAYSKMSLKEVDTLRQNISFVFQDFALVDSFNVYDNIKMGKDDVTDEDIKLALERVEMAGFEQRKIKTLSAGQKQRVSIARSIVKKPKIILCDEPTGNLDFLTSQSILKCLKEISKDVLIILVSHNLDDAYTYGSRIIELDNGHINKDIIIDESLNNKHFVIKDKCLYMTTIKSIDDEDLHNINEKIINDDIKFIKPKTELFKEYQEENETKDVKFDNKLKKLKFKDLFAISHKLLKRQFIRTMIFALLTSLVLSIFAISYQLIKFDSNDYIAEAINTKDETSLVIHSYCTPVNPTYPVPLIKGYEEKLKGEKSKDYFEIIPIGLKFSKNYLCDLGTWQTPYYLAYDQTKNYIYPYSMQGTVCMTQEQLSTYLNSGNGFEIIEQADEYKEYGLYITDVVADLLKSRDVKYLGYQYEKSSNTGVNVKSGYCNGVIKTNFYDLFPKAKEWFELNLSNTKYLEMVENDKEFNNFIKHLESTSFYTYTFEENFVDKYLNSDICKFRNPVYLLEMKGLALFLEEQGAPTALSKTPIKTSNSHSYEDNGEKFDGKISIGYKYLNSSFGVDLTYAQWQAVLSYSNKLRLVFNEIDNDKFSDENVTYIEYEIVELKNDSSTVMPLNGSTFDRRKQNSIIAGYDPVGIMTWDKNFVSENIKIFEDANLIFKNDATVIGIKVADTVVVYQDLFNIILYLSFAIVIICIVFVSFDAVRRQSYNIGVFKANGIRDIELNSLFAIHVVEFILVSSIIIAVFESFFINLANDVLLLAIEKLYPGIVPDIAIIKFTPIIFAISMLIVLVFSIGSYCLSLVISKSYKPINILKSKY